MHYRMEAIYEKNVVDNHPRLVSLAANRPNTTDMRLSSMGGVSAPSFSTGILLFSSISCISAILLKVPIDPTWTDYLAKESEHLEDLGKVIDSFKYDIDMHCATGGHDIRHENGYWETLQALVDTIGVAQYRFSGAVQFMKQDQEGMDVMESYGLPDLQTADNILRSLKTWFNYLDHLIPLFRDRADVIEKIPGFTRPDTQTSGTNLRELSFSIDLGRPDGRGNILYSSDSRQQFYDRFKKVVVASEKTIKDIEKAIIWARTYMSGPMFNKLLRGRDPDNDEESEPDEEEEEGEGEDGEEGGDDDENQGDGEMELTNQENGGFVGEDAEGQGHINQGEPANTINEAASIIPAQQNAAAGGVVNDSNNADATNHYSMEDNFRRIRVWFKCWGRQGLRLIKALDNVGPAPPALPYWVVVNGNNGEMVPMQAASGGQQRQSQS
ncbi:hypothetical protein TWF569_003909 [Orbilia oligospora]|uniref:Uncharacterized protein n=3 Tax=Orbilia oligospora TaxID=2813651 RepID=A0A7C8JBK8_ORBOL|nr:hypothetical protein TWF102_005387 [Orbilia oligospora]KAF3107681.1 hypothetical protein TWF706_002521 [Orbilia oligospora]KAF3114170.1 hypothetical protein TWF103_001587 [Orbilia oligospora]KAF3156986.1 hypothetical protein TWF569_003909 [Orbilia oligospora]